MAQAVSWFRDRQVDCLVELGDVIDSAPDLETEKAYLRRVWQALGAGGTCYPVLGNHCVSALAKPEFLEITARARSYYAFDLAGFHFVVLDACFRKDGESYGRSNFQWTDANIPAAELNWLAADLRHTPHSCIVFVHQRLDAEPPYGIGNAAEVRRVLESSGKVLAVFQGHYHPGAYSQLQGIHYCTLAAMIEGSGPQNNAYAMLEMWPGGTLRLSGQHRQESYHWPRLS
jgi:alkaline phosphatase